VRRLDGALSPIGSDNELESGVKPPHSKDAHDSDFAFEVLQSGNLTVAATILPVRADVLRICA